MSKKVTIQDVADAAGVCKATVSYVLNDRQDQKISEETKKKVWQVVNMLNYRPNAFAQNRRTSSERRLIAVYPPRSEELAAAIREVFPRVCFIRSFADGELPAGRVLVTQPTLAEIFAGRQGVELYFAQNALPAKAEVTAECVRLALSHEPCEQHVFKA